MQSQKCSPIPSLEESVAEFKVRSGVRRFAGSGVPQIRVTPRTMELRARPPGNKVESPVSLLSDAKTKERGQSGLRGSNGDSPACAWPPSSSPRPTSSAAGAASA
jgi:hypothetical protein